MLAERRDFVRNVFLDIFAAVAGQNDVKPCHDTFDFGSARLPTSEYYRHAADLRRLFAAPPMAILTGNKAIAVPTS